MSDTVILTAGPFLVEFRRIADRYAHQIFAGHDESRRPLLASIEGGGDDPWPPSPPLQELHVERQADSRQVALLVGRAGRSHWSLSVEPFETRLVFDAACRVNADAEWLGSTYRVAAGLMVNDNVAEFAGGLLRLQSAKEDCATITTHGDALRIQAAASAGSSPRTIRWRYAIESL